MNNNSAADTAITEVAKQYQEYRWKDLNFYDMKNSDISKKNVNHNEKSNFKIPINKILSIQPAKTLVSNLTAVTFSDSFHIESCIVEQPSKSEEPF